MPGLSDERYAQNGVAVSRSDGRGADAKSANDFPATAVPGGAAGPSFSGKKASVQRFLGKAFVNLAVFGVGKPQKKKKKRLLRRHGFGRKTTRSVCLSKSFGSFLGGKFISLRRKKMEVG
ncbi:MAG: hypothetical protein E7429_03225 [Ruminococcaceae bacterium]|nr:hypothetical protein [Oscillospiraceae bacterium]